MVEYDGRAVRWLPIRKKHCDDILKYLIAYRQKHEYMPSRRDIAAACGIVVSSVNYYLGFMIEDGLVEVSEKTSRAIRVTDKGQKWYEDLKMNRVHSEQG